MSSSKGVRWLVGAVLVLAVLGGLGWWFRADLLGGGARTAEPTAISPEAAAAAEAKLDRVRTDGDTVQLSEVELASLMRHRAPRWAVSLLREPTVDIRTDSLVVGGRVATDQLPPHEALSAARAFLPDTARVEIIAQLQPLEAGRIAFDIREVTFAGIPIPARYYPSVLERIGRADEPGLASSAVALSLPEGIGAARIEGGRLVLTP